MTSGFFNGRALRGLAIRVLIFLSLTMLPIGLLSVFQTRQIAQQSEASAELSLLAITQTMTAPDARLLQEAYGAADLLGAVITGLRHDPERCSRFLEGYRQASDIYEFVGFIGADGIMSCSSFGQTLDFSADTTLMSWLSAEGRHALVLPPEVTQDEPQALIASAVQVRGAVIGLVVVSIPVSRFELDTVANVPHRPQALQLFTESGQTLAGTTALDAITDMLPPGGLAGIADPEPTEVLNSTGGDGVERVYAVVTLVPDAIYALSIWPGDMTFRAQDVTNRLNLFLPIIMWVVSLIVAFWAIHRLAISNITKLGRQMRLFALNRTLPRDRFDPNVPIELAQMEQSFAEMAESILKDEATLEDNLRQKNILLKEVHHRVKNNLQLISSILNMQIRQAQQGDTRLVLERLQHRILGLATVHENLYQDGSPMLADVGTLLTRIVDQLFQAGIAQDAPVETTQSYDKMTVEPDDAAPLTLLVSEAVTNALKYLGAPADRAPEIRVSLSWDGPGVARLLVENTIGSTPRDEGSGLGLKLITAFTRQLNGQLTTEIAEEWHRLTVTFPLPEKQNPVLDY